MWITFLLAATVALDDASPPHWAFQAPRRPAMPTVEPAVWGRNPIDAFVAAEHQKRGLRPVPPADKRVLLRRLSLDLIGLPPTRDEMAAFLADTSCDAYERVVERLLSSPAHGERWGRHWMDVWRYSDWWGLGAEVRNSQKHIWHWRDWIVESLNADRGYDQMVREMLAADELYPTDPDRLRGTGFLARQYFKFNRTSWLDETITHTSKAFLGLTLNCGKCHDHKYDPFAQQEYYQLRAFFEPYQVRTDQLPGEPDLEKDGLPRAFDCNLEAPTYLHIRGDDRNPDKRQPLAPAIPRFLSFGEFKVEPVILPAEAVSPGLRPFVLEDHLRVAERGIADARAAVDSARKKRADVEQASRPVAASGAAAVPSPEVEQARLAMVLAEKSLAAAEQRPAALRARAAADRARMSPGSATHAAELARAAATAERTEAVSRAEASVARAEFDRAQVGADQQAAADKKIAAARDELAAARKALESPGDTYTPLRGSIKTLESNLESEASRQRPYPATSTGRRAALARWITDPRHPLTARVAVNHVWMRHLGRPLVPTVFDFGRNGTPPTHPALLDWLAVEFMEQGWSMKHLHRLIVTSDTYRLASAVEPASPGQSPPADSATRSNQTADPENVYLWRFAPRRVEAQVIRDSLLHLSGELDRSLGGPTVAAADEASRRRSLYYFQSHNEHPKFLALFDDANVLECYRRAESIVPQQALALSNSRLTQTAAERIATRLSNNLGAAAESVFIRAAFETVLGLEPTAQEQAECEAAMAEWIVLRAASAPRVHLIRALLNHHDFVTIR